MRLLKDVRDWLALRRHMEGAWGFVRARKRPLESPYCVIRFRDGGTMRLRSADRQVFNDIFARDEYALHTYRPGDLDTVVDLGGHVGTFAVRVAPLARRVFSYEPFPESHELLSGNVRRFPHVTVVRQAVSGRRESARLFVADDPSSNSLFPSRVRAAGIDVEAVTLRDVFEAHGIDECSLLKIDCEGAEYDILLNAPLDLLRRVRRIAVEYHPVAGADDGWTAQGLARRLESAGHRTRLHVRSHHRDIGVLFSIRE